MKDCEIGGLGRRVWNRALSFPASAILLWAASLSTNRRKSGSDEDLSRKEAARSRPCVPASPVDVHGAGFPSTVPAGRARDAPENKALLRKDTPDHVI